MHKLMYPIALAPVAAALVACGSSSSPTVEASQTIASSSSAPSQGPTVQETICDNSELNATVVGFDSVKQDALTQVNGLNQAELAKFTRLAMQSVLESDGAAIKIALEKNTTAGFTVPHESGKFNYNFVDNGDAGKGVMRFIGASGCLAYQTESSTSSTTKITTIQMTGPSDHTFVFDPNTESLTMDGAEPSVDGVTDLATVATSENAEVAAIK